MAAAMQNKLNIVAVNCDDSKPLCNEHGVSYYPNVKL